MKIIKRLVAPAAALAIAVLAQPAEAAPKAGLSSFPGPSISSHVLAVIKAAALDEKNGWELEWHVRTTAAAWANDYYTGVYEGLNFSGINYLVTQYNKGTPIRIVGASAAYPWPLMVRADSGIDTVADLRGKVVGLSPASYSWAYMYAIFREAGIDMDTDVKIVKANIIQAVNLLERGEYDATMPLLSQAIILDNKAPGEFKVLLWPDTEVARILGRDRMYQVLTMRADWLGANPGGGAAVLRTLADAQGLLSSDIERAVELLGPKTVISGGTASGGSNLPEYVVRAMYEKGFFDRKMAWFGIPASELKEVWQEEMELYKDAGLIDALPDEGIFWTE